MTGSDVTDDRRPPASLLTAGGTMLLLSLLLFWLPILGPLIAGTVGGRMAGSPGRGVVLAVLPAVAVGLVIVPVLGAFDLPVSPCSARSRDSASRSSCWCRTCRCWSARRSAACTPRGDDVGRTPSGQ